MKPLILQINIPFCFRKCAYCGQKTCKYDDRILQSYVHSVLREIEAVSEDMEEYEVTAVSIEGGSPVLATPGGLQDILRLVRKRFHLAEDVQISIQTMPGEYSRALMEKMRDCGVNHWIIGIQTAELSEHNLLQRPYKFDALTMVDVAMKNFTLRDCSFELLYGIPGQTMRSWKNSLEKALYYAPEHLTLYPLRLEAGTLLKQKCDLGDVTPCSEEETKAFYDYARERLTALGYQPYTIYDFALPGKENRFRLGQMNGTDQLGIGYEATTLMDGITYTNGHSLQEYLEHSDDLEVVANHLARLDEESMARLAAARAQLRGEDGDRR
jgi:oxygen-independent coproporphyrinogen-3 oxidase